MGGHYTSYAKYPDIQDYKRNLVGECIQWLVIFPNILFWVHDFTCWRVDGSVLCKII
jgi:hypothetical protein